MKQTLLKLIASVIFSATIGCASPRRNYVEVRECGNCMQGVDGYITTLDEEPLYSYCEQHRRHTVAGYYYAAPGFVAVVHAGQNVVFSRQKPSEQYIPVCEGINGGLLELVWGLFENLPRYRHVGYIRKPLTSTLRTEYRRSQ